MPGAVYVDDEYKYPRVWVWDGTTYRRVTGAWVWDGTTYVPWAVDTAPEAPSGLHVSGVSPSTLGISWVDNSTNEHGFLIYESSDGVVFQLRDTVGPGVTNYQRGGLAEAERRWYQVSAFRDHPNLGRLESDRTAVVSGRTLLQAPTDLEATALDSSRIQLTWTNHSPLATHIEIRRDGVVLVTVPIASSYTDEDLDPDTLYAYTVYAIRREGGVEVTRSDPSNIADARTHAAPPTILAPQDVSYCDAGTPMPMLRAQWVNGVNDVGWVTRVERSVSGGSWTTVPGSPFPLSVTHFDDAAANDPSLSYRYRARHEHPDSRISAWSESVPGSPDPSGVCPPSPTPVSATDASTCVDEVPSYAVEVTWAARAGWTVEIERSVNGGSYAAIATPAASPWIDEDVSLGNRYRYRIRYRQNVGGRWSTGPWAVTGEVLVDNPCTSEVIGFSAMQNFAACPTLQVRLTWTDGSTLSGLEYRPVGSPNWASLGSGQTSPVLHNVPGIGSYEYRARKGAGVWTYDTVNVIVCPD